MRGRLIAVAVAFVLTGAVVAAPAARIDPDLLAGMKARSVGPAGMSGRVVAIDAVASDPRIVYVGAATGGLWKSINAGLTWEPIFDDQPVASIGAVAINQTIPDMVWVGTGEGNPRNSVSVGNGVYRSVDGGRTWTHLGLKDSERIHRIVLHPTDPDTAWVAALGQAWGENKQRGIFKTSDGGKNWRKVLFVDDHTGGTDIVMDPTNPDRLLAATWDFRRRPWFFRSGGPGSGLYVSSDGGETWTRRTPEDGLPEGDLGRMGLAMAPSQPGLVYAIIETKKEIALYKSTDGGDTWNRIGADDKLGNRPFYFSDIHVDPQWPDRVYSMWSLISVSDDGGKSFRVLVPFAAVHPDHHAMWIDPADGNNIIAGNDGGVAFSQDRGKTWRFAANLPLAQYYHLRVDMDTPYHIYGGMQDNGSWRGPASVWENGGIRNHHWEEVDFGDGFDTLPHPEDSMIGYAMSQEGFLARWDQRTGERKDIRPAPPQGEKLRFNWNAALAQDPFAVDTIYFGSQYVHRSRDRGESWEIISGDLTSDNPDWQKQDESGGLTLDVTGAENYTSIIAITPSPVEKGVLWVGTDDGRLHVTRDGGDNWTSVESRLRGVPAGTWIPHIAASPFAAGTAFIVLDDHRRSSWKPYVYRTDDFGRTWQSLGGKDIQGYCLTIEQDPVEPDLLYLGTEFGLFISMDAGATWMKWTHGVPTVSVMDLTIHPREHDLILGTHGRSAYVLDDIRPLRQISATTLKEPLHLFPVPDAQQYKVKQTGASRFPGAGEFRGENRPYGALITFSLNVDGLPHPDPDKEKARKEDERRAARMAGETTAVDKKEDDDAEDDDKPKAKIEVFDQDGEKIRTMEVKEGVHLGVNRLAWNLRRDAFKMPPTQEEGFFGNNGPEVLPGVYKIRVTYGEVTAETSVRVLPDPRFAISRGEREAKWEALARAGAMQEAVAEAVTRIMETRDDIDRVLAHAKKDDDADDEEDDPYDTLRKAAGDLKKSLAEMEKRLREPPDTKGIIARDNALSRIRQLYFLMSSSWDAPTPSQMDQLGTVGSQVDEVLDEFNHLYTDQVDTFRRQVREAGIQLFADKDPLQVNP
ncbi:MAG: hypothetical protein O7F11_03295 [Acidobacteria bacterium]|nr:hypothetical protein [Acidobacteriota bacterium]